MFVADIIDDASEALGYCQDSLLFRRLTDAVEVLANKGQWDPLIGYLDIVVQNDYFVTLPREVECPVAININGQPSFSRSRIYEFTLNGPGSDMLETTGYAWEDQGDVPVLRQPDEATTVLVLGNAADNGKTVTVRGFDAAGQAVEATLILGGANGTFRSTVLFQRIDQVFKDTTQLPVTLKSLNGTALSVYASVETEPTYRRIKLNKRAAAVRMMFRRVTHKIVSRDDFIPLHSKMALLLMLKSLEAFRKTDFTSASALETQSIKLITEEQQSRNAFLDMASHQDDTSTGSTYRDGTILIVSDVYDDASKIFGPVGRGKIFDRITDAVQLLANKGNWDPLLAYLDIRVFEGNIITLPPEVDTPVAININNEPALARDRLFEFTLNTPGSTMLDTSGFTWDDRGTVPIFGTIRTPMKIFAIAEDSSDIGKKITVHGRLVSGRKFSEQLTISATPLLSTNLVWVIDRIEKEATTGFVLLNGTTASFSQDGSSITLSRYYPEETEPSYRRIKLSTSAASVRILFRKKTAKVSSMTDTISLGSKLALMMGLRAVASHMAGKTDEGKKLEDAAFSMLQEQQAAHLSAAMPEVSATNTNINNRDSIIVADVYDDAAKIFGMVGRLRLYDKITESVEALANESQWDGLDGYVDIMTDRGYMVTLPRYVETPLGINLGGSPLQPRNRFFEFHLNGPGSTCGASCGHWDNMDEVVTFKDLSEPMRLFALSDRVSDEGLQLRVYGFKGNGQRVTSIDDSGVRVDGALITVGHSRTPSPSVPLFKVIDRIEKPVSSGFIQLFARHPVNNHAQLFQIGYYYPDETEPNYKRIRLPQSCAWIRMRYRKRTLKVSGTHDPLHLKSKTAIVQMMHSIDALDKKDYAAAQASATAAIGLLAAEQKSRNPVDTFTLQIDTSVHRMRRAIR